MLCGAVCPLSPCSCSVPSPLRQAFASFFHWVSNHPVRTILVVFGVRLAVEGCGEADCREPWEEIFGVRFALSILARARPHALCGAGIPRVDPRPNPPDKFICILRWMFEKCSKTSFFTVFRGLRRPRQGARGVSYAWRADRLNRHFVVLGHKLPHISPT